MVNGCSTFPSLLLAILQIHAHQCGDLRNLLNSGADYLLLCWQAHGGEGKWWAPRHMGIDKIDGWDPS